MGKYLLISKIAFYSVLCVVALVGLIMMSIFGWIWLNKSGDVDNFKVKSCNFLTDSDITGKWRIMGGEREEEEIIIEKM